MTSEPHGRARRLIDAGHVEGIPAADREWLEAHLAECPACQAAAESTAQSLQILRSNRLVVEPEFVARTQARVRWRARELREEQARQHALWISCGLSWLLGTLTAPLLWEAMAWMGRHFDLSPAVWITGFAVLWVAPAAVGGALVAWRRSQLSAAETYKEVP